MRHVVRVGVVAALLALASAAPAQASRLLTLTTTSRFVDPEVENFNSPPPGAPPRSRALRLNVLLPDGYTKKRRWPVLYLLHGHGDAYDYWANPKRGNVAEIAKGLPAIVVMPEAARGWYADWWRGGGAWERYHLGELVPLVEKRFPIMRGRRWHAIAGLSMGGLGAIYYAEQRPGYFGAAASFSGVLSLLRPEWPQGMNTQGENSEDVYGPRDSNAFYWEGHDPTTLAPSLRWTRVFVTVGNGVADDPSEATNTFGAVAEAELHQHAEDFVAAARSAGVDVEYQPRAGIHDWPYWRQHLAAALQWGFFKPVEEHPTAWRFSTVARWSSAWGLRIFFPSAPRALETFERDGDVLRATGSGLVRIRGPQGGRLVRTLPFTAKLPR